MAGGDWIKLHRKLLDSPIFQHDGLFRLWGYCLLRANWKDAKWLVPRSLKAVPVPRGSFVTGRSGLHAALYPALDSDGVPIVREWTPCPRTVWRWLEALAAMGCVEITSMSSRCSIVTICNYKVYQDIDDDQCPARVQHVSSTCPARVQHVSTIEEGKKVRREEGNTPPLPPPLDTDAFKAALAEWQQHRREQRLKAYTPTGLKRQLARLAGWGEARAVAAIGHSIAQGFQGIYEPKEEAHGRKHGGSVGPHRVKATPGEYAGLAAYRTVDFASRAAGDLPPGQAALPGLD